MHHITRRLSPSTMIATVALIAATSGTAIAAGEIITSPDQIAFDVITNRHIQHGSVRSGEIEQQAGRGRWSGNGTGSHHRLTAMTKLEPPTADG